TPYTYLWSNNQTNASAINLTVGTYSLTATDNNGCSVSASVTITQPLTLSASASATANVLCNGGNNGSAASSISGGTTPYTYLWSNNQTNASAINLTVGTYSLTATDNNGCSV